MVPDANIDVKKSTSRLFVRAPGHGSSLRPIRNVITDLARQVGFPEDEVAKIEMAVDEACTNVVEHAYEAKRNWAWKHQNPEIRLTIHTDADRLVIQIHDNGKRFDFASYRPVNLLERIRAMRSGGYGIAIMRKFMDEVEYKSDDVSGNTLRLVKHLKKS
jgi:serine/threonine-protein kinase RsbW